MAGRVRGGSDFRATVQRHQTLRKAFAPPIVRGGSANLSLHHEPASAARATAAQHPVVSLRRISMSRRLLLGVFVVLLVPAAFVWTRAKFTRSSTERMAGPGGAMAAPTTDTITIDGSNGVMPLVAALAEPFRRAHPETSVIFGNGMGSGARIAALRDGKIDIALASHGLDEAVLSRDGLTPHRIATTAVVFAVNATVPIESLAAAQICEIFTGRRTVWRDLAPAAESLAVTAVVRAESEVDMEVVRAGIDCLEKAAFDESIIIADDTEAMRRALLGAPGAIGVSTATITEQSGGLLRALAVDGAAPTAENVQSGRYPLVRDSYLVTAAIPSPAVARFLDFARSPAAREVLAANGAVSVR